MHYDAFSGNRMSTMQPPRNRRRSGRLAERAPALVGFASLLVAVSSLAVAGCPADEPDEQPVVTHVDLRNSAFTPREVTIRVGQSVRWTNEDPVIHTVTSGGPDDPDAGALFDSGDLIPFDSFDHTFDQVGEFFYFSKRDSGRPGMVGAKVTVTE